MSTNERRSEIKEEIINACGGIFASRSKLCRILKIGEQNFDEFVSGMEFWERGRRQYYLVSDIAGRIVFNMERSKIDWRYRVSVRKPDIRGMSQAQITRELSRNCHDDLVEALYGNSFATSLQISRVLNISRSSFNTLFGDLEFLQIGHRKLFLLNDISKRIRANRDRMG
jgi:hypothetical protein